MMWIAFAFEMASFLAAVILGGGPEVGGVGIITLAHLLVLRWISSEYHKRRAEIENHEQQKPFESDDEK